MTAVASTQGTAVVSIAEASRATGVPIETLRYYEKIGLIPSIHRSEGGQRLSSGDDLDCSDAPLQHTTRLG